MKHILMILMVVCWFKIDANTSYLPVPGGWLYRTILMSGSSNLPIYQNVVYVPFVSNNNDYITVTPLNPR